LLVRVARPRGNFLGRVRVRPGNNIGSERDVYVPLKLDDGVINPNLNVEAPAPGIVIYRFEESFLYPNSSLVNSQIVDYAKENTRRGIDFTHVKLGDRPWNDPGPRRGEHADQAADAHRPLLHAVIFDFSGVSNIDTTGVQALVDTRNEVERWVDGPVEFHFATILSPWIRRALVAGGFGGHSAGGARPSEVAPVVSGGDGHRDNLGTPGATHISPEDAESHTPTTNAQFSQQQNAANSYDTLVPQDTPFFHFDLPAAVAAAEASRIRSDRSSTSSIGPTKQ
jgi:sodium-independent sulfate anion transporter 11